MTQRSCSGAQPLQIDRQFFRRLITAIGILVECLKNNAFQSGRNAAIVRTRRRRRPLQNCSDQLRSRSVGEKVLAGGHFVEDRAGGVDISAHVRRLAPELFGSHVRTSSADLLALGKSGCECDFTFGLRPLGEAEIHDL